MMLPRSQAFQAIDNALREASPESTASERGRAGVEACLLIIAMTDGAEAAAKIAYQAADDLAVGGRP